MRRLFERAQKAFSSFSHFKGCGSLQVCEEIYIHLSFQRHQRDISQQDLMTVNFLQNN